MKTLHSRAAPEGKPGLSKSQIDEIVYKCRQEGNDSTYAIVNACLGAQQDEKAGQEACATCHGTGKCDDADLGDMYYNEWPCPKCSANTKPQAVAEGMSSLRSDSVGSIRADSELMAFLSNYRHCKDEQRAQQFLNAAVDRIDSHAVTERPAIPAQGQSDDTLTIEEVWKAIDGQPGYEGGKANVLLILSMLAKASDECEEGKCKHRAAQEQAASCPAPDAEAIRSAALEEAAKICDAKFMARGDAGLPREASAARACRDEIRALKSQPSPAVKSAEPTGGA